MADESTNPPKKMADEVADRVIAALMPQFEAIDRRFEAVDKRFDEAAAERQAMREVIDSLASQEDFDALDRKISSVSADTQATRQGMHDVKADVSRLRADVKAAGIPVR